MRNDVSKGIRQGSEIKIKTVILNPKEGIDYKRLSMALNLVFSEKDLLSYLKGGSRERLKFHSLSPLKTRF
jgi:hypothetical protein